MTQRLLSSTGILITRTFARNVRYATGVAGHMDDNNASRVTYPPLDSLKPVADGVWIVDSGPLRAMGLLPIPVRMTVIKLTGGEMWLHSPTRYVHSLAEDIAGIGRIGHLVAPNIAHWSFIGDWQEQCPQAESWAAPGLRSRRQVRKSDVVFNADLDSKAPPAWQADIGQLIIPGGFGVNEVAFFHKTTRTLILTDLVENFERRKLSPLMRPLIAAAGAMGPDGKAPLHYRLAVNLNRKEAAAAARRLLDWQPERVIFAHGQWFERDGSARLRHSLRWLLD